MQRKTIEKVIKTKLEDWLSSITDVELQNELRQNILVSGGSIASIFLQEPVNDYDIYLKDINVLKKVCLYYTEKIEAITILDGREKESLIKEYKLNGDNEHVPDDTEHGGEFDNYSAVALRTLKEDLIKLIFAGASAGLSVEVPEDKKKGYLPVYFSPNAISLSNDIQIVLRFWGDNKKVHETFDFIHATNYFTFKDGLVTNARALESLLTKQLHYQGSLYPLTSIIRIKKFLKRGWNINAGEQLKIMFQISELDLTDVDTLEEQLIGVDVAYFGMLIKALREKANSEENWKPSRSYIVELIDSIFN